MVNNNTDTEGFFTTNTSLLQFCQGKAAAFTKLTIIADSLATNGRAEKGEGADTKCSSFSFTSIAAAEFPTWLVKPCTYMALPVFAKMVAGKG